jgi:hypothetical protein
VGAELPLGRRLGVPPPPAVVMIELAVLLAFVGPVVHKEMNMCGPKAILVAVVGSSLLGAVSRAQDTVVLVPAPATELEAMETNTGTVIVKGIALVGSMSIGGDVVSVICKEDTDAAASRKQYGISIKIAASNQLEARTIVDSDEMDSFLNAIDYLAKIDWSATSLTSFDAGYTTKAGFKISAFGSKGSGTIQFSMQAGHRKPILITAGQLGQFRGLIDQAKRKLDEARAK